MIHEKIERVRLQRFMDDMMIDEVGLWYRLYKYEHGVDVGVHQTDTVGLVLVTVQDTGMTREQQSWKYGNLALALAAAD